jgi:hypothetical protein
MVFNATFNNISVILWRSFLLVEDTGVFESLSGRGVQHYVIKFVAKGRWFSPGTPVSSTNKNDRHNITEILLKVALNTIKQT